MRRPPDDAAEPVSAEKARPGPDEAVDDAPGSVVSRGESPKADAASGAVSGADTGDDEFEPL